MKCCIVLFNSFILLFLSLGDSDLIFLLHTYAAFYLSFFSAFPLAGPDCDVRWRLGLMFRCCCVES
jgi:hypothetical protein